MDHLDVLRSEGATFVGVLDRAAADLLVATCGNWRLRDLVHHLGEVHGSGSGGAR